MEDISASCLSLKIAKDSERSRKEFEASRYNASSKKTVLRQVLAASLAASFHVVFGISLAYSAILNPELLKKENNTDFVISLSESSWVASVITLAVPVGAPFGGIFMDTFGRLNTVKIASFPAVVGWVLIATSNGLTTLLIGRILTGLASTLATGPAIVFITEIARADIRGSLISFAPAYTSLGMVLAYLEGWAFGWRITAWICVVYAIAPFFLVFLIHESPAWLISKGRNTEALKSLQWLNKHETTPADGEQSMAEYQFEQLKDQHAQKQMSETNSKKGVMTVIREFLKPTGYKPMLILFGLFLFQQFSGIYITLFYSIAFFEEVGSDINPYLASILIGAVRAIMSVVNTYMLKTFRRRPLILWSAAGMAVCMLVSGLFTMWIKNGTTTISWIPVVAVMLYVVASMIGLLSIPWTMTAELFPIQIRGVAHSLVSSVAYLIMFFSVQSYNDLNAAFNGVAGLQWFFAAVSLGGLIFSFIFLPETHGLELSEIQDYFENTTVYLFRKKAKKVTKAPAYNYRKAPQDIIKRPSIKSIPENGLDQSQTLLPDA